MRCLERIEPAGAFRELAPGVLNRFLVHPFDQRRSSPFILLVEDLIEPSADAFGLHPHRGFETVMIQLAGRMAIEDSLGHNDVLEPGGVEWTRAGRGILHGGQPLAGEKVHALQLWLNLPARLKMSPPRTVCQPVSEALRVEKDRSRLTLYAGRLGHLAAPYRTLWPLMLMRAELAPGGTAELPLVAGERAFAQILSGTVKIEGVIVPAGHSVWFGLADDDASVTVASDGNADILFYASPPIEEPVAIGGPFVMNSDTELAEAEADLAAGRFGR